MEAKPTWVIIDGQYFLHRNLHMPDLAVMRATNGTPSGGVYGFLNSLRRVVEAYPGTRRVIVAWDTDRSHRRSLLYPGYKGNREPKNQKEAEERERFKKSFGIQCSLLKRNLIHFGVRQVALPGKEGDDVIKAVCDRFPNQYKVVASGDRDLFQLVNTTTRVYRAFDEEEISTENFLAKTGSSDVARFLVSKSIVGDKSDNITGVGGVGEKTVETLLESVNRSSAVGTAEVIEAFREACSNSPRTKGGELPAKIQKVLDGTDSINRNLQLIDLSKEDFTNDELLAVDYYVNGGVIQFDRQKALAFLASLDMSSIIKFFSNYDRFLGQLS